LNGSDNQSARTPDDRTLSDEISATQSTDDLNSFESQFSDVQKQLTSVLQLEQALSGIHPSHDPGRNACHGSVS
jgi:hypothetical protein